MNSTKLAVCLGTSLLVWMSAPSEARACGGFFCGRQPVDQTAERILFEISEDSVTMTTQISFNGDAEDFAWILPLGAVPDANSLAVFPQRALATLDANTGPTFVLPSDCYGLFPVPGGGLATASATSGGLPEDDGVTVHIREEVGNYDVAVIESTDPDALIDWLRQEGYRVTPPMEPYIELYTNEGMKFLALKLLEAADVNDISPFRFSLPGTTPSIPLRMTSLAAEPEMSIVVFVLGDQRYEGKNWENITIDDGSIRFDPNTFPTRTNYASLVAQGVDDAGGQGWVTEFAGLTAGFASQVQSQIDNGFFNTPEDAEAALALLDVLQANPYITRLYTRVSAEEMTLDPILGRSDGEDVSNIRQLQRIVDGVDQCPDPATSTDPCDFVTCGAGGICRSVTQMNASGVQTRVAACGCVPGATARTTFAPDGTPTVICQDQRMSFLNPGDQEAGMETLPDPCATFDCGSNGRCVPVNMTPTCECDAGFVATGSVTAEGVRVTTCTTPDTAIPDSFYEQRLPELPQDMPGGREVEVPEPKPVETTSGSGGTNTNTANSSGGGDTGPSNTTGASGGTGGMGGVGGTGSGGPSASGKSSGGGCTVGSDLVASHWAWLSLAFGVGVVGRRRRSPSAASQ